MVLALELNPGTSAFFPLYFLRISFFKFIYSESVCVCSRAHVSWGEKQERERIPSRLHAVSIEPGTGLDPVNCEIMT